MALFKIFKGSSTALGATSATQAANEGFAYFTPDDGKFYIDIADAATAVVGVNRIPLNAHQADYANTAAQAVHAASAEHAYTAIKADSAAYAATAGQAIHAASANYAQASLTASYAVTASAYLPLAGGSMEGRLNAKKALNTLIKGSGTAATTAANNIKFPAKWTFDTGVTVADGDTFIIQIPCAGHDYGVFMSVDNGANYYPIVRTGTSRLTTHYGNGEYIQVVYESGGKAASMYPITGSTATQTISVGGHWKVVNDYDSGNDMGMRVYRQTSGYTDDDYPILVSRTRLTSITSTNGGYVNSVYGVVYGASVPTLQPSTGLLKVPGGIQATLNGQASCAVYAAWAETANYAVTALRALSAGSAGYAASAAQATHSASANYAQASLTASYSVTALRAISAGSAGYAASAANSTYAGSAGYTQSALTAAYAVTALRAMSAGSAGYAASAAQATHSASANWANLSGTANQATKVTQNASGTANTSYRVLLSTSGVDTAEVGALNKSTNLQYNPSTNSLTTGNLDLSGELQVTGDAYLHNETYADNVNAGNLVVTGAATFTNIPTAPTPASTSNDTSVATTAFVKTSVAGLSGAMHFRGTTTTTISDGSTTNPITIGGSSYTASAGDVVLREISAGNIFEYVWTGSQWEMLGRDTSFKVQQTAVDSGTAATNKWVSRIQQDTNGVVTATMASLDTSGTWSGNAASATKVNNNLIIKLKSGSTEGTDLYTYNGSATKTLDIKQGTGITLTAAAGSLTIGHSNSVTAKTAAAQSAKTLTWGGTFTIYEEKYDAQGHVTGVASYNMTMPSNPNTDYRVRQTNDTSDTNYRVLLSYAANNDQVDNITHKSGNLIYNPSANKLSTGNLQLTGTLNVSGQTTLSDNLSAQGITATDLLINGAANFVQSPTAPTPADGDSSTKLATTAFIKWDNIAGKPSSYTPSSHTHGNITNDGKIGSTANYAVYTTTNGVLTAGSLATSDPTADGNSTSFIATISQDSKGKITATKKSLSISAGTSTLAWESEVTLATIGGTAIKAKLPANPNTNTTYTFASGTDGNFTVTPSGSSAQTVSIGKPATAGAADTAIALTSSAGSINKPVYFTEGQPAETEGWAIEYIVGTQTAATGSWTGVTKDSTLVVGKTIAYKLPYAGSGNASLTLTFTNPTGDATSGAKAVYAGTTRLTTHYGAGSVLVMTWDGSNWRTNPFYNSDSTGYYILTNGFRGVAGSTYKVWKYSLFARLPDGTYESFTNTSGTGTSKTKNPHGFIPDGKIYWNSGNSDVSGTCNISAYEQYHSIDYRYTFNISTSGIPAGVNIYIKWTYNITDGLLYLADNWFATALPTTEDGFIYQRVGSNYYGSADYRGSLLLNNPYYIYTGSNVHLWTPQDIAITGGTNKITVQPLGADSYDVTITPSIANNITGSGTSGYLSKFNGTNTITNGPVLSSAISSQSQSTKFLREDGAWAAPSYTTSLDWSSITGKPSSFTPSSHTHYELATIGDQRTTATTPNTYANRLIFQGLKTNSSFGSPSTDTYSYVVGLRGWSDSSGGNAHELAFNNTGIYWRSGATTSWGSWYRIYTTGNKPTKSDVGLGNVTNDAQIPKSIGTAKGDIIYWNASSDPKRLAVGSDNQVLTIASGIPSWSSSLNLAGTLDVTGNTSLHNETTIDSATIGNMVVTGGASFTQIPTAPTATAGDNSSKLATTEFVYNAFTANDAMVFKGVVNANSDLPATHYQGWTYKVGTAGSYVGTYCEIGDLIICVTDGTSANNAHWVVIQNNVDGAVFMGHAGSAIGSDTQPVYIKANGEVVAGTALKALAYKDSISYTPAGSVSTVELTPAGTNAKSAVTIKATTTDVYSMTSAGSVTAGSAASLTMSVTDETLSFSWTTNTPTAVTLPGRSSVIKAWTGYSTGVDNTYAAAQVFTGTTASHTHTFTGTAATLS